jgi:hypothetical protein
MKPDGTLEFDTVDEALFYQARKASRERAARDLEAAAAAAAIPAPAANGAAKWSLLLSYVGKGKQHAFLRALRAHPDGLTMAEAMKAVGVDVGSALAGVIGGGLAKNIVSAGMEPSDVYVPERVNGDRIYRPGPLLMKNEVP